MERRRAPGFVRALKKPSAKSRAGQVAARRAHEVRGGDEQRAAACPVEVAQGAAQLAAQRGDRAGFQAKLRRERGARSSAQVFSDGLEPRVLRRAACVRAVQPSARRDSPGRHRLRERGGLRQLAADDAEGFPEALVHDAGLLAARAALVLRRAPGKQRHAPPGGTGRGHRRNPRRTACARRRATRCPRCRTASPSRCGTRSRWAARSTGRVRGAARRRSAGRTSRREPGSRSSHGGRRAPAGFHCT